MREEKITEALLALSSAYGVAGAEDDVVGVAADYFGAYCPAVQRDRFGNLLAFKAGEAVGDERPVTVAVVAHIDEIGAMVTAIEPGGFLRFTAVGGIDPRVLPGQSVTIFGKNRHKGVIGAAPPHLLTAEERAKVPTIDKLFIDPGLEEDRLKEEIGVGDFIAFDQDPLYMETGKKITGKALDNRAGVVAALSCAAELTALRHRADVFFVASLQEEVGLRGAIAAAYGLKPDLALVIDVTHAEAPGLDENQAFKLGGGPAIGVGPNLHPFMSKALREKAGRLYLPHQVEPLPGHSGTDAWAFQVSREGIPTALVSIPLRYMHTTVEVVSLDDLVAVGKLLAGFIGDIDRAFLEELKKC